MARALNMPIPAFHAKAIKKFDGIAYFFDEENDFYTKTQSRLEYALHSLLEMAAWKNVALIGTSGGGTITLRLPDLPLIHRRISSSPPVLRDQQLLALLEREDFVTFQNSRIFFAYGNPTDTRHYKHLRDKLPANLFEQCVFNLAWASHSHGTLGTVMRLGALDDQLRWLSQSRDSSKGDLISSPAA
jgi:hypothetical protein